MALYARITCGAWLRIGSRNRSTQLSSDSPASATSSIRPWCSFSATRPFNRRACPSSSRAIRAARVDGGWRGSSAPSRSASTPTKLPSRTTATTPGSSPASASRSDLNWNTLSPLSSAAARRGSALAPGFSGAQNTPATSSLRARNASRTAFPKSCWPMMAMRMFDVPS